MKKQAEESKHDKFVRLAEARTNKIIDTLQLLGNCSNTSVYEYTQDEVEEIFQPLRMQKVSTAISVSSCEILRLFLPRRGFCDPMGPHLPDRQRYHSRRNSGKREKAALINGYENRIPIPAESSSILHP